MAAPGVEALEARALLSAGDLLVRFADGGPSRAARLVLDRLGAEVVRTLADGPSVVRLPAGTDPAVAARQLDAARGVRYAEPDGRIQAATFPLNDLQLPALWGLNSPNDVDINAPEAWSVTTGDPSVIVAVIDGGIDLTHPDLLHKVWVNPGEVLGNGRDDDRNGKIDDVFGWNFLDNTPLIADHEGHGTHIAGTIAAVGGNSLGIAGVAPGVRIMPLKFIGRAGDGAISDAVDAIYYAVNRGAKVINASWGGGEPSQTMTEAIRYASNHNVVFVTAAGNEATNNDVVPSYPANVNLPNVLSVAAVNSAGGLADFSNYGARTVDLGAPGVEVLSTVPGGGYARYSGTSMAVPHVAGVVALLATRYPHLTAAQLVQWTIATAKPLPALVGRTVAGGMVDAFHALAGAGAAAPGIAGTTLPTSSLGLMAAGPLADDDARAVLLGSDAYFQARGGTKKAFLASLYRDVLGTRINRATQNRLLRQLRQGHSRQEVARGVLASPQAQRVKVAGWLVGDYGGTVSAASLSSRSDVTGWAAMLSAGWSDTDVHAALFGADAYWSSAGGTAEGFATALFSSVLGRFPSAGEVASVVDQLGQGRTTEAIARDLLATVEAKRALVARWYQHDLGWDRALADLKSSPDVIALAGLVRP